MRSPFVVTVTAAVAVGALGSCGGNTDSASQRADSGPGGSDGSSGVDAAAPCPPDPPTYSGAGWLSTCIPKQICHYDIACQSGEVSLDFECSAQSSSDSPWKVLDSPPCSQPYDSCPGTSLLCSPQGGWYFYASYATNPPGPCPASKPSVGSSCSPGGFGGDPDACGYPCASGDSGADWTVMHCDFADGPSLWTSDNACN